MASRTQQKAQARAQREALQRQHAVSQQRRKRLIWLGGALAAAIVALVIVIAASSGGSKGPASSPTVVKTVNKLLAGIPQSGNVLGNPKAKVTITEYGDLVCPVCGDFAKSSEQQLIAGPVRSGKAKLVYRALETASATANGSEFVAGQVAARAAGQQDREWQYVLTWYLEQQSETTAYVNDSFLRGIAQQVKGLNLTAWQTARNSATLTSDVNADQQAASNASYSSTPTVIVQGPKGTLPLLQTGTTQGFEPTYSQLQTAIADVS